MLRHLLIFALAFAPDLLPTGPACCDLADDYTSCTPFEYLADVDGCDPSGDVLLAWCDFGAQSCVALELPAGDWRCCYAGDTSKCIWPIGEASFKGDEVVACEADREPTWCECWAGDPLDPFAWSC